MKDWDKTLKTPYLTVDAVVIKDRKILMVKRNKGAFIGRWALPGGFVQRGETLKEASAREVLEETGLKIIPEKIIGIYDDPKRDPRFHAASVAFLCNLKGGELKPQLEEVKEARFFPLSEIRKLRMAFDHMKIAQDGIRLYRRKHA